MKRLVGMDIHHGVCCPAALVPQRHCTSHQIQDARYPRAYGVGDEVTALALRPRRHPRCPPKGSLASLFLLFPAVQLAWFGGDLDLSLAACKLPKAVRHGGLSSQVCCTVRGTVSQSLVLSSPFRWRISPSGGCRRGVLGRCPWRLLLLGVFADIGYSSSTASMYTTCTCRSTCGSACSAVPSPMRSRCRIKEQVHTATAILHWCCTSKQVAWRASRLSVGAYY
jgi:hypothetical protein